MFSFSTCIDALISTGLRFIAKQQQRNGSFLSLSTTNPDTFRPCLRYHATFTTSLILSSLTSIEDRRVLTKIRREGAAFLLSQKSRQWSWNYWSRRSAEAREMPFPDDLDDTFAALIAIHHTDQKYIDRKTLTCILKLLLRVQEKDGGPYRTWLVPKNAPLRWYNVDLAINSSIGYFLSLHCMRTPELTKLVEKAVQENAYVSHYYPSSYSVIYFISRFYKGDKKEKIVAHLFSERRENKSWGNILDTALVISALLNFDVPHEIMRESIEYMIKKYREEGWRPHALYFDPTLDFKSYYYNGASTVTAAFTLESLDKYRKVAIFPASHMA